jgi:hypothetical protein
MNTKTFILNLHDNYGSPEVPVPTVARRPVANDVTPNSSTTAMEEAEWFFQTAKRKRLEPTKRRRNRRQEAKEMKEKQILKVKVGALVRKNLTRYGVGGDKTIVVHDVPTLGLVKRLRNCTGRFLVEFDNKMRLELRYEDFMYLTNTPEKQVLARGQDGNMTVSNMRDAILDDDIQFLGVSDSPFRKNKARRDYGVNDKVEDGKKSDKR